MKTFFKGIGWQNFLSFGNNWTYIDLVSNKHTCIIGSNGSGKSVILDVITFGLFGKPFRKINKGNLINSIIGKDLLVHIDFDAGGDEYRIIRGIKPNILRVFKNGTELYQEASIKVFQEYIETQIIGVDYRTFIQVVILGSANFIPYMRMPIAQRRNVVEDILGIRLFSNMNHLLKVRARIHRELISNIEKDLNRETEKLRFLSEQTVASEEETQEIISKKEFLIANFEIEKLNFVNDRKNLVIKEKKVEPKEEAKKITYYKNKIESNSDFANNDIEFLSNNNVCPACLQAIDDDYKKTRIAELNNKMIKFNKAIDSLKQKELKIIKQIKEIKLYNKEIIKTINLQKVTDIKIEHIDENICQLQKDIKELETHFGETVNNDNAEIIHSIIKDQKALLAKNTQKIEIMNKSLLILRDDGAKTKIIEYYLPIINSLIAKYLQIFSLNISFTFDGEFNEIIKTRYQNDLSYFNFSEGEKARIDISLMFAWRDLAKRRNSVITNIILLDELFDGSLDAEGLDDMKQILDGVAEDENVIVISHRNELKDQFANHLVVEKPGHFSNFK